jgi:hypothetical protein
MTDTNKAEGPERDLTEAVGPTPAAGTLLVGTDGNGEVVINHPDLQPDADGAGHIVFSPQQAESLASLLYSKAADARVEAEQRRSLVSLIAERDREWCIKLCEHGIAALATSERGGKITINVDYVDGEDSLLALRRDFERMIVPWQQRADLIRMEGTGWDYREAEGIERCIVQLQALIAEKLGGRS